MRTACPFRRHWSACPLSGNGSGHGAHVSEAALHSILLVQLEC